VTTMGTLLTPAAQLVPRDRWGRPLVIPPEGGTPVAYTRCTTYVSALEDRYSLGRWQQRMVAIGLAERPDLLLAVAANRGDKDALNEITSKALDAAQAGAAATVGTALHALTEQMDRGLDVGTVPAAYRADLDAYAEATKDLKAVHIEEFCVLDPLKVGGTPDRIVKYQGKRYIADLKSGGIEYGALKIAMQLAVYARSKLYDPATGERIEHDADRERGIVVHLPAGSGRCELRWVDLLEGWRGVALARQVREMRALRFPELAHPFIDEPPAPTPTPEPEPEPEPTADLAALINACGTADEIRKVWALHQATWSDEATEWAKARIAVLTAAATGFSP
jgi:hypothetical protein